jgi:hypothetical protein
MKKYISLIVAILAGVNLVYGFVNNQESASIFGIAMNIWVYRAVWVVIGITSFLDYYKAGKKG